jgi:predicted nucleic acid-binding protein
MNARVFVDTNVWAYVFDAADRTKQKAARRRLDEERKRSELVVSTQVMQELFVCLTRGQHPITTAERAERAVRDVSALTVVQIDTPLVLAAIAVSRQQSLSLWDALIVQSATTSGCSVLLTEDLSHGQIFDGVRVENPFW